MPASGPYPGLAAPHRPRLGRGSLLVDEKSVTSTAPAEAVYARVTGIGGDRGCTSPRCCGHCVGGSTS